MNIFVCFEVDVEILTRLPSYIDVVACHSLNRGVVPFAIYSGAITKWDVTLEHKQGMNIDGLVQKKHNSIANALELHASCTDPSIYALHTL